MPLNHVGGQVFRAPPPITRPPINLRPLDTKTIEAEAREAQARVRTIRAGRDAWEAINKAQSFDGWKAIGAALAVGKRHALKVSGASQAWGRNYSREFSDWIKAHSFEKMPPTGAPAQAPRSPAIGHKTLASLKSARQRQMPRRPTARR